MPASPISMRSAIERHKTDLHKALGEQSDSFDAAVQACMDSFARDASEQAAVDCLLAAVNRFPAAAAILRDTERQWFPEPGTGTTTVREPDTGGAVAPPIRPAVQRAADDPAPPPKPATPANGWTNEQVLQALKELVAAIIGIALVVFTLQTARIALDNLDSADRLAGAKDILLVMNTLVGVVLGYYFGRLPSDARAAESQKQADTANDNAADVGQKAAELSTRLGPLSVSTRASNPTASAEIEQLRKELLELATRRSRR
jgi:hypothetical protein